MRTACHVLIFICATTVVLAGEMTKKEIRVTATTAQSPLSVQALNSPTGTCSFLVRANVKDHNLVPLDYGALRIYDGTNLVSSCVVNHGYEKEGKVAFGFTVGTNYCAFSKFSVAYSTNSPNTTYYWFYLKDFCQVK